MKTGLSKKQKSTTIYFDEASPIVEVHCVFRIFRSADVKIGIRVFQRQRNGVGKKIVLHVDHDPPHLLTSLSEYGHDCTFSILF